VEEINMNVLLWVLQIGLALKFMSTAYTHGLNPDREKMDRGKENLSSITRPLLVLIALCTLIAGVGLVLPIAVGIMTWVVPWTAASLSLMMLFAIGFHLVCRENPNFVVGLILFVLTAFVAYGRWVIAPF
jgi:hypothetical protein